MSVQPFQRGLVLVPNLLSNPYDRLCVQSCRIGKGLPEMVMICGTKLILNNDDPVTSKITDQQIAGKFAHGSFFRRQLQIHSDGLAKRERF